MNAAMVSSGDEPEIERPVGVRHVAYAHARVELRNARVHLREARAFDRARASAVDARGVFENGLRATCAYAIAIADLDWFLFWRHMARQDRARVRQRRALMARRYS